MLDDIVKSADSLPFVQTVNVYRLYQFLKEIEGVTVTDLDIMLDFFTYLVRCHVNPTVCKLVRNVEPPRFFRRFLVLDNEVEPTWSAHKLFSKFIGIICSGNCNHVAELTIAVKNLQQR